MKQDVLVKDGKRQLLATIIWQNFTYISAVMALLYVAFALAHYLLLEGPIRTYMTALALVSVVLNALLFVGFYRGPVREGLAHPLATLTLGIVLANSACQLYLTDQPRETTNFVLIIIACGVFYGSTPWTLLSIAVTSATWIGIAVARDGGDDWTHFGIFSILVVILSVLVHILRMKMLGKLVESTVANDIQRVALELAIEDKGRAQERFRRLSEATFEAIFIHRNGQIADVNEQAVHLFGYTRVEFQQMRMDALLAPEVRSHTSFKRKTLHSATGSTRDGKVHESTAMHKSGRRFPIEFGALRDRPDKEGLDAAVVRDITDRQRLEHRYRDFVENAIDYIYETDAQGRFTYVNGASQRLLRHAGNLIGQDCYQFIHVEHRDRIGAQVTEHDFSRKPMLYQEFRVFINENDLERWVGQIVQPIFSGGVLVGYRMVARNVTDRVMAVRQALTARRSAEEADRSKSRFLSAMSHELRTPLNGILGFAQILREGIHGPLNGDQREDLGRVIECSDHLLTLIEDLLDLSKADIDAIKLHPVPLSADIVVQGAIDMVRQNAREKSVTLSADVFEGLWVSGESRRLRQILLNLLSNAVKYSPAGAEVHTVARPADDGMVEFVVADRGPGVPAEHQVKIFSEFFQSDYNRDGKLGGSGIGLALVRKLVSLHEGDVGYRARSGGGSEFWFTVPATTADESDPMLAPSPESHQRVTKAGRILLVDDIEVNAMLVREALTSRGHTVAVARNGLEALERAVDFEPDLVLMDMRMPVMDGFQATQKLKAMPQFQHTPIVALSASVDTDAVSDCISAGCVEHLDKPVELEALFECVERNLLGEKKADGPPRSVPGSESGPPLHVLIAEDNETNRDFMSVFFKKLPDTVHFATNGREAVETALNGNFDLVFMDVQMPEMNGLDATRAIRKHIEAERLPIIGLSGLGEEDDIQACLSAGMNGFMTKPIRFVRIVEVLDQYRRKPKAGGGK